MTGDTESLKKLGYLALSVYSEAGSKSPGNLNNTLPSGVEDITNDVFPQDPNNELPSIGYSSTIYKDSDGNVIIAYRGSQNPLEGDSNGDAISDWFGNDIPLVFGDIGAQFFAAYTTYTQVRHYMHCNSMTGSISFTGHSLGGALADFMGALTNNDAYGYETLPVANLAIHLISDKAHFIDIDH